MPVLLVAVVSIAMALAFQVGRQRSIGSFVITDCTRTLVLLQEDNLPLGPLQINADLRGGGAASLPVTTDQTLLATGSSEGHQYFRPTAAGLAVAFQLPASASLVAEIRDEGGAVLRRVRLTPLIECESP